MIARDASGGQSMGSHWKRNMPWVPSGEESRGPAIVLNRLEAVNARYRIGDGVMARA